MTEEKSFEEILSAAVTEPEIEEKKPDALAEEAAPAAEPEGDKKEEEKQPEEERKLPDNDIPASWRSKERKAIWEKVDHEIRSAITKREAEMSAGFYKRNEDAELGKSLSPIVSSIKPLAEARNLKVQDLVKEYAQFDSYLSSNASNQQKVDLIAKLASAYGVNINGEKNVLQNDQNTGSPQSTLSPSEVRKIIRAELDEERQASVVAGHTSLISSFESKNPEFSDDRIRQMTASILMGNVLPAGMSEQESLESAFNMAKNLFPEYRTQQHSAPVIENQGRRSPVTVLSTTPIKNMEPKQVQYAEGDTFEDLFKRAAQRMQSLN
jgi:hypothetical protein